MIKKVTDPTKIVTDGVVLRELVRHGIDKDYVEFYRDYCPRSEGGSPYAKFYQDLKSGKRFMVVSGLPKVKPDGQKIEVGWIKQGNKYISKANLFSAIVEGKQVQIICLSDQPTGAKKDDQVTYRPQLLLDGVEIVNGEQPTLLPIDPINENYRENTLEWDYGNVCKRRIRIIEGRFRERWIFDIDPKGEVRIKHNFSGNLPLKLGYAVDAEGKPLKVTVVGDEELVPASEFDKAAYPVEIGASATFYPDADEETLSVDGWAAQDETNVSWATIRDGAGNSANDVNIYLRCADLWSGSTTDTWNILKRGIFLFDTSGLPDDVTISAATLSLWGQNKNDNLGMSPTLNIYSSAPASNTAVVAGDYDSLGTTPFSTTMTYADWTLGEYNDFSLNASGIAAISKTGVTKFGTREAAHDVANSPPSWVADENMRWITYSAEKGAGYKPKLVVTYTVMTEKTSSDTGSGVEDLTSLLANITKSDAGSGAEALGSRLLSAADTGSGIGASSLLAALIGTEETGLGLEFATKVFSAFDSGSGIDAVIARLLAATETGSSVEVALLITALISGDGGFGSDLSTLLKAILTGDEGSGFDALKALIETTGSDMRLHTRPGQVRMPSKGVNL